MLVTTPVSDTITIDKFLSNAAKQMGKDYWQYDAFTNNCQVFVDSLLKYNDLLTPEMHAFIFQDVQQLREDMGAASKVSRGLTDLAARMDTFAFGKGLPVADGGCGRGVLCECDKKKRGRKAKKNVASK